MHFEVEADFFHRERDVLVRLHLDLATRGRSSRRLRGIWITLVIAASPLIAIALLARLRARALDGAPDGLADRLGVDDGFLVDGVLRRGLGRVGLDSILPAAHRQLDQLDRGGRDVKADKGSFPTARKHNFSFPTRDVGNES